MTTLLKKNRITHPGSIAILENTIASLTVEIEDLVAALSKCEIEYTARIGIHKVRCQELSHAIRELEYKIRRLKGKNPPHSAKALNEEVKLGFLEEREYLVSLKEETLETVASLPIKNARKEGDEPTKKKIRSLYMSFVRQFHPEFEADETRKQSAREHMVRITELYTSGDLTNLEKEVKALLETAGQEKEHFTVSDSVLKQIAASLHEELADLKSNEMYSLIKATKRGESPESVMDMEIEEVKKEIASLRTRHTTLKQDYKRLVEEVMRPVDRKEKSKRAREFKKGVQLYKEGNTLQSRGDSNNALTSYQHTLGCIPEFPIAYGSMGQCYFETGNYKEAAQYLKKYVSFFPTKTNARGLLGLSYYHLEDYPHAVMHLERVVQESPEQERFVRALGLCLYRQKNHDDAIPFLEGAFECMPFDTRIIEALGECYYKKELFQKTIEFLGNAVDQHHATAFVFYLLGMSYLRLLKSGHAVKWFKKAIELRPESARLKQLLIRCYEEIGMPEEAERFLAAAIKPRKSR